MVVKSLATAIVVIFIALTNDTYSLSISPESAAASSKSSPLRIGTRSSKLAKTQAITFQTALHNADDGDSDSILHSELVYIDASGDQKGKASTTQQLPLAVTGVNFVQALDDALLNGSIDVAVHSLKDIPPACRWNDDLIIGAYLGPRETPQDVLITNIDTDGSVVVDSIQTLPRGARVGSASIRRQAQLLAIRSDLNIVNIRGNVDARLKALDNGEIDALILLLLFDDILCPP